MLPLTPLYDEPTLDKGVPPILDCLEILHLNEKCIKLFSVSCIYFVPRPFL